MYKVFWINFDYYSNATFETLEQAIAYAKSQSFEAIIYKGDGYDRRHCDKLVASVSTLGGVRAYT